MTDLLPFDLEAFIRAEIAAEGKVDDGLLHPSSHLTGSLRHVQLERAGAPRVESELLSLIRLKSGSFWHDWLHDRLRAAGVPVMCEVDMTPFLPEGWGGKPDWLIWHPAYRAWVLADLKTANADAISYVLYGGAKTEHIWQTSTYWHGGREAGLKMVKGIGIVYLPFQLGRDRDPTVNITMVEVEPLPKEKVWGEMERRRQRVEEYLKAGAPWPMNRTIETYLNDAQGHPNDALEPVQPRVQKLMAAKKGSPNQRDLVMVPHWSAQYCPYPAELCNCSYEGLDEPKTFKIGAWLKGDDEWFYEPREGYEEYKPEVSP